MPPETENKRRYSLFSKPLKSCVEPLLRPVLKSQGIAASKLITEWEQLIGKEMAARTLPLKLTFPKDKNADGTLTIACEGAHALTLQHMQPMLIERIASYFGYRAVARIQIEQRPVKTAAASPVAARKTVKSLNTSSVADVEDAELKTALSDLAKTFAGSTMDS